MHLMVSRCALFWVPILEIMVIEGCANPFDGNDYYPRPGKLVLSKPVAGNDQRFVQCLAEPGVSGSTKFVGDELLRDYTFLERDRNGKPI